MQKVQSSFDVAVVGGGVIGMSCAWRLAQRGINVVLLERDACGAGASGASLGALWPANPLVMGELQEMQRKSLWGYGDFAREIRDASEIDVEYHQHGRIELITDAKQLARANEESRVAVERWPRVDGGPVMETLNAQQVRELEPAVEVGVHGGQLCRASAQVNVEKLIAGLNVACDKSGVEVRQRCAVKQLEIIGNRVLAVRCESETINAERVLVAAGAWTAQLHPLLAVHAQIKPVRGQALMLEMDRTVIGRIIKNGKIYLVPWGNRLLVGSTTEPEAGFNCSTTEAGIVGLLVGAKQIVPALRMARVVKTWAGLRPDGPRHKPVIGAVPGVENLFVAAGHFKTGIGLAPETSRMIAEMIAP